MVDSLIRVVWCLVVDGYTAVGRKACNDIGARSDSLFMQGLEERDKDYNCQSQSRTQTWANLCPNASHSFSISTYATNNKQESSWFCEPCYHIRLCRPCRVCNVWKWDRRCAMHLLCIICKRYARPWVYLQPSMKWQVGVCVMADCPSRPLLTGMWLDVARCC